MSAGAAILLGESATFEWWLEVRPAHLHGSRYIVRSWAKDDPVNFGLDKFKTRIQATDFVEQAKRLAIEQGL